MTRERFEALVAEALAGIPQRFQRYLTNVEVVIEDAPLPTLLRSMGLSPQRDVLFGLYEGVPLSERGDADALLPDRITIFYRPLVREFRTPHAIRREVRKTVIHEVAHFFGLDDDEIATEDHA